MIAFFYILAFFAACWVVPWMVYLALFYPVLWTKHFVVWAWHLVDGR